KPLRAHGPPQERGCAGLRLLHEPRQPQSARTPRPPERLALLPLGEARAAGARGGEGGAGLRRGGRRLLRLPPPRQPGRRLGLAPERDPPCPRRSPHPPPGGRAAVRGQGGPAPSPLVRLPHHPPPHRVLAGPPRPPPRA